MNDDRRSLEPWPPEEPTPPELHAPPPLDRLGPYRVPPRVVDDLRTGAAALARTITQHVEDEIPGFAGAVTPDQVTPFEETVVLAVQELTLLLTGTDSLDPQFTLLLRRLGFAEGAAGQSLAELRHAIDVAMRHVWATLMDSASHHALTQPQAGAVGDALFSFRDHLDQAVTYGHRLGQRHRRGQPEVLRARLIVALLDDSQDPDARNAQLTALAFAADWPLPASAVVLRIAFRDSYPAFEHPDHVLLDASRSPALLICEARVADEIARRAVASSPEVRVSLTGAVSPPEIAQADRWARRALQLVELGPLQADRIIDCEQHQAILWHFAEPTLRHRLIDEHLGPLLDESPAKRLKLAETMLASLSSHDSAAQVGVTLGVHAQTVRYRLKRLRELFGDQFDEPEFRRTAVVLLRSTVPLWRAGRSHDADT